MAKLTKRAQKNISRVPADELVIGAAVAALKSFETPKFDQTVDIVLNLGIDAKQADQMVRGSVSLPNGIGKTKRVVAFCQSDVVDDALAAGAIKAGGEELVAEIEKGWMDFDVAVASPDMMRVIAGLGRVLGPKGLMPSPKAGTVTKNVAEAVKDYAAGKVEYRNDTGGNVHAVVGKMSFSADDLAANATFFIEHIEKSRPSAVKGTFIKKISVKGTQTPGVLVKVEEAASS